MIFQPDHMVQNGGNRVCPEFGFKSVIVDHVRLPWIESLPPNQSGASAPKYALVRQGSCLPRQGIGRLSFDLSVVSLSSIARARKAEPTIRSVASPNKIIWIRPEDIVFKIILPGEWGLKRNLVADTKKYRSISQHFLEDVPWQDTVLFEMYARRLGSGELVRGVDSLAKLAAIQSSSAQKTPRPQTEASPKRGSRPASTP
jgi:hypothetical protein